MFRASSSNLVTGPASASLRGQFQPVLATHHHAVTQHLRSRPSARLAQAKAQARRSDAALPNECFEQFQQVEVNRRRIHLVRRPL